jgi:hypothetical protein
LELIVPYENELRPKDWLGECDFVVDLGRTEYDSQTNGGDGDDRKSIQEDL